MEKDATPKADVAKLLTGGISHITKIRSQLLGGLARQTASMMQGGLTDEQTCNNLAKRLFDFYDKDGSAQLENHECGMMIEDVYKLIGRNYAVTDDDKSGLLKMLDKEGKGYVDVGDFEGMMKKYLA
jgi:Ca2+-binding EF-hand superfamily protein